MQQPGNFFDKNFDQLNDLDSVQSTPREISNIEDLQRKCITESEESHIVDEGATIENSNSIKEVQGLVDVDCIHRSCP